MRAATPAGVDPSFGPLVEKLQPKLATLEGYVIMTDEAHLPKTSLPRAVSYEKLIENESDRFEWPELDERSAARIEAT